jgi:hypothetical protein
VPDNDSVMPRRSPAADEATLLDLANRRDERGSKGVDVRAISLADVASRMDSIGKDDQHSQTLRFRFGSHGHRRPEIGWPVGPAAVAVRMAPVKTMGASPP